MTKPKVLISDKMDPNAARIFEERGCDVDVKPGMSPDELAAVIGEYDGLAIRSATKVTLAILEIVLSAACARYGLSASTSTMCMPVFFCRSSGVPSATLTP